MNDERKPLTKALHTVCVVERLAAHLKATRPFHTSPELLAAVLNVLGNDVPADAALADACLAACKRVLP